MGRLFWKFFVVFWLAQLVTVLCVGVASGLLHAGHVGHVGVEPGMHAAELAAGLGPPPGDPRFHGEPALQPPPPPPDHEHADLSLPVLPIAVGSVVSLVFAVMMALHFSRPIRALHAALAAFTGGKLATRVGRQPGRYADEIDDLGQDFNRMAAHIQALVTAQRRLLHDVSHELRSPLARLQVAADLMHQQPERSVEFADRMLRDTERMDILIGELLTLARLEEGGAQAAAEPLEPIHLREVASEIVECAVLETQAGHCQVHNRVPSDAVITGRVGEIYRALENILRNGLRYSPPGGVVLFSAERVGGCWCIVIEDQGPGVFADDLPHIFDPFFRSGSAAESSGCGNGNGHGHGHGLGLAITRRIIEAHGGTVSAHNRVDGGLQVRVLLPA